MSIRKAVFPVAGFGTRMLPATKSVPKEMITLVDRPIIQYAVEEALEAGIEQIIFVTGRTKKVLEDHFDHNVDLALALEKSGKDQLLEEIHCVSCMADIIFVRQKEQLGLGHAVYQAKDIIGNEPFAVLLPDDIFLAPKGVTKQLVEQYEKTQKSVIALQEVPFEHTSRYGIVSTRAQMSERLYHLDTMVEKPKENPPSNMAIIGRYILTPEIMHAIGDTTSGALGEIQLTDAIRLEAEKGNVFGYCYEGKRFDCGNKVGYLEAFLHFAQQNPDTRDALPSIVKAMMEDTTVSPVR